MGRWMGWWAVEKRWESGKWEMGKGGCGGRIKSGRHVAVMEEPKRAQQSFH